MRIVREQMLCIVVPGWPDGEAPLIDAPTQAGLTRLLAASGVIHYSSLALLPPLPPLPGQAEATLPSLLFELTTEEGMRPHDLIALLVQQGHAVLWELFGRFAVPTAPTPQTPLTRGQESLWLHGFLTRHAHAADGAFVGVRDRSVKQILQERQLFADAAAQGGVLAPSVQRESQALRYAAWALRQSQVQWASAAAPRSFWRGAAASTGGKIAYLLKMLTLGLLLLGLFWLAAKALSWGLGGLVADEPFFDAIAGWLASAMKVTLNLTAIAALAGIAFLLLFALLPTLLPPLRGALDGFERNLDRPGSTPFAGLLVLLMAGYLALLLPLLALVVWTAMQWPLAALPAVRTGSGFFGHSLANAWWAALFGALVLVGLGTLAGVVFTDRTPRPPAWRRAIDRATAGLHRSRQAEVPRAQQVHASIDACEAGRVDGTAHMISLTEIRRPYAWNRFWLRRFMRVVTFVGHVFYTEGRLGDAPGIKFGHWHIVDRGRRLLFCSNYDGAFGGYLDDFIHGASSGLNAFWRFTELQPRPAAGPDPATQPEVTHERRFPPTRFVVYRGVKCEQAFKAFARDSMLPHLYHFEAYNLTMSEIERATRLRDALYGPRTPANDDQIMRAMES